MFIVFSKINFIDINIEDLLLFNILRVMVFSFQSFQYMFDEDLIKIRSSLESLFFSFRSSLTNFTEIQW
jgi:hypothetical protein